MLPVQSAHDETKLTHTHTNRPHSHREQFAVEYLAQITLEMGGVGNLTRDPPITRHPT